MYVWCLIPSSTLFKNTSTKMSYHLRKRTKMEFALFQTKPKGKYESYTDYTSIAN